MMKKKSKSLLTLCAILSAAAILSGCGSKNEDKLQALEDRMTQIQNDISELQARKEEKETQTVNTSKAENKSISSLEGLTASVERMKEDASAVIPADTEKERMAQYFDIKNEMKQLTERIDAYDDNLEIQYKSNSLSYTDYCIQERMAEDLKSQLTDSENSLKQLLRVDAVENSSGTQ